jgi:hypothetical protein
LLYGREAGHDEHDAQDGRDLCDPRVAVEPADKRRAEEEDQGEGDTGYCIDLKYRRGLPLVQIRLLKHSGGEPEITDGDQEPYKGHDHCEHPVIGGREQSRKDN